MQELRVQIDKLDRQLIEMLVTRAGYIDRASRVETKRGPACPHPGPGRRGGAKSTPPDRLRQGWTRNWPSGCGVF